VAKPWAACDDYAKACLAAWLLLRGCKQRLLLLLLPDVG
jgi:hypothetical protein